MPDGASQRAAWPTLLAASLWLSAPGGPQAASPLSFAVGAAVSAEPGSRGVVLGKSRGDTCEHLPRKAGRRCRVAGSSRGPGPTTPPLEPAFSGEGGDCFICWSL